MQIFVADDDAPMLELVAATLRLDGFSVTEVANGEELIRLVTESSQPDLVITDVNMPGVGGLGVLSHLRKYFPMIPVILMSSFATPWVRARAAQGGPAAAVLSKPFRRDELRDAVTQVRREPVSSAVEATCIRSPNHSRDGSDPPG